MKTKSGKRIFAIIAVILFTVLAIIIPIYATAKGITANAAIAETPNQETDNPPTEIVTAGQGITTEVNSGLIAATITEGNVYSYLKFKMKTQAADINGIMIKITYVGTITGNFNISLLDENSNNLYYATVTNKASEGMEYITYNYSGYENTIGNWGVNDNTKNIAYIQLDLQTPSNNRNGEWIAINEIKVSSDYGVTTISNISYESYITDYIISEERLQNEYNQGYANGYDKGAITNINPVTTFLEPVDSFLNTPIFGNISIGNVLSVGLFVTVAIIFIKMFAGG